MANDFLCQQISGLESRITEYQNAALALATNKIQQFSFDTGQTRETVTKFDVRKLEEVIDALYNRYEILCQRCGAGRTIIARPCW